MPVTKRTPIAERSIELLRAYHLARTQSASIPIYTPIQVSLRNKIAVENDRLARKVAHRATSTCSEPYEDLLQLARIGLLKAIDRFDPTTGNAFSSFAVPYIRGEIQHYLRDAWGTVKVPRRSIELSSKVKRIKRIMDSFEVPVCEEQIADALQLSPQKWQWIQQAANGNLTVNLDECHDIAAPMEICETIYQKPDTSWVVSAIAFLNDEPRSAILEAFFAGVELTIIARRRGVTVTQIKLWIRSALAQLNNQSSERKHHGSSN